MDIAEEDEESEDEIEIKTIDNLLQKVSDPRSAKDVKFNPELHVTFEEPQEKMMQEPPKKAEEVVL